MRIGGLAPLVGEPSRFCSHHDGCAWAHIVVVVLVRILQLGCQYLDAMLLQEGDTLLRCAYRCWYAEHATDAGTNQVGVIHISERVAHDDGIHSLCLCTTQHSAKVAGLLYTLKDYNQRVLLQLQAGQ